MSRGSALANRLSQELRDENTRPRAVVEIAQAFRIGGGRATEAAILLEVSLRAMQRWMQTYPELEKAVRAIREEKGVLHDVGSPARAQPKKGEPPKGRATRRIQPRKPRVPSSPG